MTISFDKDDAKSLKIADLRATARWTHVGQNGLMRPNQGSSEEAVGVIMQQE